MRDALESCFSARSLSPIHAALTSAPWALGAFLGSGAASAVMQRLGRRVLHRAIQRAAFRHWLACFPEDAREHRPRLPDRIARPYMIEMRLAVVEIVALGQSAQNPVDKWVSGERRGGRGGVGRLAVVDEQDAVLVGDALHAVGKAGVGAEALSHLLTSKA